MCMERVIDAIILKEKRILLVKKVKKMGTIDVECWIPPGGKPEMGESDIHCLDRECREELSGLVITVSHFFTSIVGRKFWDDEIIECFFFFAEIKNGEIIPSKEITDARFCSFKEIKTLPTSETTEELIRRLHKKGYF